MFGGWPDSLLLFVGAAGFSLSDILVFSLFLAAVFCCVVCWMGELCCVFTQFWGMFHL